MLEGFCEMQVKDQFFGSWAPAAPRVKPWRAPRYCQAAYCDSDKGVRPIGHSQRASPGMAAPRGNTSRLRGGHRSPHTQGPSGALAPGYGRPRPAACQGQALPACGAGALAATRGSAAVRITQLPKHYYA